jgi:hypothetical protein
MVKISNVVVVGQNMFIKYWPTTLINPLTGRTHNLMVLCVRENGSQYKLLVK